MIVRIDTTAGTVQLVDPGEFTRFHVEADADAVAVAETLGVDGRPASDDHVWIRLDALRRWAGAAADAAWEQKFAGMVAYAGSKGWLDESGEFVQAHIEHTT